MTEQDKEDIAELVPTPDLTDYVKNTDYASRTKPGILQVGSGLLAAPSSPILSISPATANNIKEGTETFKPIAPSRQHAAVFYGLAKAAGDTTQAQSSNAVGTYTDEAKTAIKEMIDVHDGQDGYTPVKGVDYFTEQDIASLNIPPKMAILKYGISTWNDFMEAYTENAIVYCRASSASNPATGSQTRLAFMAFVSNESNPVYVEFQYYRSVTTHTDNQQGDQVFIYKLDKTAGWTVTVRNTFSKIEVGTGINKSYLNNAVILSLDGTLGNIEAVLTTLTTGGGVNGNS